MFPQTPKISVILPCFESINLLDKTLDSIKNQDWPALELIVIDGGSRDGTRQFLEKNQEKYNITHWVSEADTGISDAFNKGYRLSSGDYLYFIGAGDSLCGPTVFSQLLAGVDPTTDTLISGQVCRNTLKGRWVAPDPMPATFNPRQLLYKMAVPHQGLLTHRRFFETYGLFDCDLKYAMDYELLLRAWKNFPKLILKPIIIAEWIPGGVGADNTIEVYREYRKIKSMHQIAGQWWLSGLFYWHCSRYKLKRLFKSYQPSD